MGDYGEWFIAIICADGSSENLTYVFPILNAGDAINRGLRFAYANAVFPDGPIRGLLKPFLLVLFMCMMSAVECGMHKLLKPKTPGLG